MGWRFDVEVQFVRNGSGAGHFPVHAQCLQKRAPGEEVVVAESTGQILGKVDPQLKFDW